jgi:electron transfer flavoprotein alpha subunit
VANFVVFAEVRDGAVTAPSRHAVAEARRVASELGATVYALLAIGPASDEEIERLAGTLAAAGADRVLCCADQALAGPPLDVRVGPLLVSVAERLRPMLTLLPAGAVGPELGAPLAVRTAAVFHPRAALELVPAPAGSGARVQLVLRRCRRSDDAQRALDLRDCERPVVATVAAGAPVDRGEASVEAEMLSPGPAARAEIRELSAEPDDAAALELADTVLIGPPAGAGALPAGAVMLAGGAPPPPSLDVAHPARVLLVGDGAAPAVSFAPDTVVAVAGGKNAGRELSRVDVVWRASEAEASGVLGEALRRQRGERTP